MVIRKIRKKLGFFGFAAFFAFNTFKSDAQEIKQYAALQKPEQDYYVPRLREDAEPENQNSPLSSEKALLFPAEPEIRLRPDILEHMTRDTDRNTLPYYFNEKINIELRRGLDLHILRNGTWEDIERRENKIRDYFEYALVRELKENTPYNEVQRKISDYVKEWLGKKITFDFDIAKEEKEQFGYNKPLFEEKHSRYYNAELHLWSKSPSLEIRGGNFVRLRSHYNKVKLGFETSLSRVNINWGGEYDYFNSDWNAYAGIGVKNISIGGRINGRESSLVAIFSRDF